MEPLWNKGLEENQVKRKRLNRYWIQPDFILILHLNKRLING
jgi:murein endopeptidase